MKKMKNLGIMLLMAMLCCVLFALTACGGINNDDHTHTYSTQWSYDEDYHWYAATCEHTDEINGRATHLFNDNVCYICGYQKNETENPNNTENPNTQDKDKPQKVFKTVSFNLNGGNGSLSNMQFSVGEMMSKLPSPTRGGYTFVCWEEPLFGEEYTAASLMPNRDLQLRAKWEKIISSYDDQYISFKPASEGYKDSSIRFEHSGNVDKFVYVELTSDDLGGVNRVGTENNFNLRTLDGMEYKVKPGYTWSWYQGSFSNPNGAQRFTLRYGSNIQFVTISDNSGVVQQTYLLDIYVKHDYYISLYSNVFESEPYDKVRVIENERFSAETKAKNEKGFEFDKRVYYNQQTLKYEDFVYSTAIRQDWDLYQTYKPVTIEANLNEGTLSDSLIVTPYTQYFTLPAAEKDGYDFLGWQDDNGRYLTNIMGYSGINYISEKNNPEKLTAIYAEKKYYYTFDDDTLKTFKTVPVVTYTDKTMTEILDITYVPYNTDCVLPVRAAQGEHHIFTGWQHYYLSNNKTFNKTLSFYDFNTKITAPLALVPNMEVVNGNEYVVPLNGEITSSNYGTYRMYLPANERYKLIISTTNRITLTINQYGATSNSKTVTVQSSSPQTYNLDYYVYNLGSTVYAHGYVTFNVTSLSGSFTAQLVGSTAETDGSPMVTNDDNTSKVGEEFTVSLANPGYAFAGWYEGEKKVSNTEFISMEDRELILTAKWVDCPVTLEKSIADAGTVSGVSGTTVIGSEVTITATTKSGYTWVGWFEGETELTKELSYTFNMSAENTTYTAKWIKVTIDKSISSAGSVNMLNSTYKVGDEATVTASTFSGYTWVGWFNGDEELTKELSYTFEMPAENTTYTAKWVKVTLARNNTSAGSISTLNSKYISGQEVTITATTYNGYTFIGWYEDENKLSNELSYTFEMPAENTTYTAKWVQITLTRNNITAGSISTFNSKYISGQEVTITATTNNGYTWLGWYDGETKVSDDSSLTYTFDMPEESKTYTAKWMLCPVTLEQNLYNAGTVSGVYGATAVGANTTIMAETNNGYTWLGWYNGETKVSDDSELTYTFVMTEDSKTYTAKWSKVTIEKNINEAGNISSLTEKYVVGDEVTLTATTNNGYTWLGWYDGETKVSEDTDLTYTFEMTEESKTYTAKWNKATIEKNISEAGSVSDLYGKYVIGDEVTVEANTNLGYTWLGWYDGETKVSEGDELTHTFVMTEDSKTYIAKWSVSEEMEVFNFTSTPTTAEITGIKDKSLKEIVVPDYVTSVADGVFSGCSKLEKITVPFVGGSIKESSDTYQYPFGYIFGKSRYTGGTETVQYYYGSSTSSYTNSIYYIPTTLKKVTVMGGEILYGSFYNCSGLTEITIPDSVTSIGDGAFRECRGLTSLTIPDSVTSIGSDVFRGCRGLTSIVIPDSVTSIGNSAFYNCSGLTSITIPDSVTSIGDFAFRECRGLTSLTIPDSVTSIGMSAFAEVAWYENQPDGVVYAGKVLYKYKGKMLDNTTITVIDGTKGIAADAFYNCSGLTSITIPNSVTSIDRFAFEGCSGLTSITIPDSVTSIGIAAFRGCSGLMSIMIPDSVTYIGENMFKNCSSLTSITISGNVTSIGTSAFEGCSGLTRINFDGTNAQWRAISKGTNWKNSTGEFTVYCSGGSTIRKADAG